MICLTLVATLALAHLSVAQVSVGVEAIEAHFQQSAVVPDLLASFNPSALISLNFAGVGDAQPGQLFAKEQVAPTPTVTIAAANSSVSLTGTYTLAMVDADVVGSKLTNGQTRHWLVNGVTVSGVTLSNSSAIAITEYAGPAPAAGSGPHRYVVLVYSQPSTFKAPTAFSQANMGVSTFDFNAYVTDSGLGALVAGTYFTVEEGTATASISSTSAVVSSTLLAVTSQTHTDAGATSSTGTSPSATESSKSGASSLASGFTAGIAALALAVLL
ncbi:hypothetical protein HYPSUDRAFT_198521 [Hypholoma sublateritium FD-334 SS-4]|uniref:PEBP-like protein n=1 Tax=Hypholoma sublateritium (strain FD-334 SS-4) TaxID=945553 RepID=A0A0D2Q6H8_HYPSF|nr:hypothetical protein HYPSUDRAFT_198521 [Hypholoma sublateritium FD-334 SS-4]